MQPINVRKSNVEIGNLYFWTATINNWYKLLQEDALKEIIISSLRYLSIERKIEVYAFVLMPNHVHFIWQLLEMNGKEKPHTSFLKFTAHSFKKYLQINNPGLLKLYAVDATNKDYEFWQRDSLPFELSRSLITLTTIRIRSIGNYVKSQLIIITLLQSFMKPGLMTLAS